MSTEIAYLTATELLARYRDRSLSPVEATRAALARIAALNPALNAFNVVDAEGALQTARQSEARWLKGQPVGLLDGVPTSIKDVILTKGWPTLRGSRAVDPNQRWDEDAPATARLRAHGAVLLGKTTTPEFGWKGVGDSPLTGITRNPWNPDTTPGGSSAGSAVQVAAGMGPLTIGTDGGGSVRIPAAFTGIVALKPTFGRIPAYPSSPFGTLAHVGPMAWTVADAALMLTVLAEPDARDWYQLPPAAGDFRIGLGAGVQGLKVLYSPDLGYATVDPEVAALVRRAAEAFAALGATVEERRSLFPDPTATF
ncbi:MAG: amidase, partial [Alphaproteobacteria bacterium]|nr:amidase [Alphaproteobacteria bacterium]